jgi:hypothetical protein
LESSRPSFFPVNDMWSASQGRLRYLGGSGGLERFTQHGIRQDEGCLVQSLGGPVVFWLAHGQQSLFPKE